MAEQQYETDSQSTQLPTLESLYFLEVRICKGIDLAAGDITGKSDPFCKVIANGQVFETQKIMTTLNPEWNEVTNFAFFDAVKEIKFEVWDWDKMTRHDALGDCTVDVSQCYVNDSKVVKSEVKLNNCKKGSISIEMKGRCIKPLALEERCKAMQQECNMKEEEIVKLDKEIETQRAENDKHKAKENEYKTQYQTLESKCKQLNTDIAAQQAVCDQSKVEKGKLSQQYDDLKAKCQMKMEELERKQKEYENRSNDYEQAKVEKERVYDEREKVNEQYAQKAMVSPYGMDNGNESEKDNPTVKTPLIEKKY